MSGHSGPWPGGGGGGFPGGGSRLTTVKEEEVLRSRAVLESKLLFLRKAAETERFHSVRTIHHETVGHHSFGVAWLCWLLRGYHPSAALLMAALAHDAAEHEAGDMPSPTKRALGIREQFGAYEEQLFQQAGLPHTWGLTAEEDRALQMADLLDGMLSCVRERALGNQLVTGAYRNFSAYIRQLQPVGVESELYDIITSWWEQANGGE